MKKLAVASLVFCSLATIGCAKEDDVLYTLTLKNHEQFLIEPLQSRYRAGTAVEVYTTVLYDDELEIFLNDEKIEKTGSDLSHWKYEFVMPSLDSILDFRVVEDTKTETIHDYVEIHEATVPESYFSCDMRKTESPYDFSPIQSMMGDRNTNNYEYGFVMEADVYWPLTEGDIENHKIHESQLLQNRKIGEDTYQTQEYYYRDSKNDLEISETYQYDQIKNNDGLVLNQTNDRFHVSTYGTDPNSNTFYYSLQPSMLDLLKLETEDLVYQEGIKDGCEWISVSGTYTDSTLNRQSYDRISCKITYAIKDRAILSWMYEELATDPEMPGYWKTSQYCFPNDLPLTWLETEGLFS